MSNIKIPSLDTMLGKRQEELGTTDRFDWAASEDLTFSILDPRLMPDEQRDELALLRRDLQDGEILPSEFNAGFLEMYLDDQVDAFLSAGGTTDILTDVIRTYAEQMDPTRRSSRNIRRQSKRR